MKVVDIKTGEKHEVRKYVKSESDESVWCLTWYGRHVIGKDCEFESDAKCECNTGKTTGWTTAKLCNICGKEVNEVVEHIRDEYKPITSANILSICCSYFGYSEDIVKAKSRKSELVTIRFIAMKLSRMYTLESLSKIGSSMTIGDRVYGHDSVLHGIAEIERKLYDSRILSNQFAEIEKIVLEYKNKRL